MNNNKTDSEQVNTFTEARASSPGESAHVIDTSCPQPLVTRRAPPIPLPLNQHSTVNDDLPKAGASYQLSPEAPIVDITQNEIEDTVEKFLESLAGVEAEIHGDNLAHKALGCRAVAEDCIDDTSEAVRIFSYQLDKKSVGLMSVKISQDDIYVVGVVGHPAVQDAGYVLIEHVLQYSLRQPPWVRLTPENPEVAKIYQRIGFKPVSELTDSLQLDFADVDTKKFWQKTAGRYVCIQAMSEGIKGGCAKNKGQSVVLGE